MPTAPDPNSPYPDARLQSEFGLRTPGTPSSVGKPAMQAGDVSFPAPPAVAGAPVGRPPNPGMPMPTPGMPLLPPTQPAAQPTTSTPQRETTGGPSTPQKAHEPPQPTAPTAPPPMTTPTMTSTGEVRHTLTPEGDARYRETVMKLRTSLGPIPSVFRHASLPQIPVVVGKPNFNPFTAQYDG